MKKDPEAMKNKMVEVSAIITKVKNNPPEITYFTHEGYILPQGQEVKKEKTESGTKFFTTPQNQ